MSGKELASIIGKTIAFTCPRTGTTYNATVTDAKLQWGKLRLEVSDSGVWFEPTHLEAAMLGLRTLTTEYAK